MKRIIAILSALAMVLSMGVFCVSAEGEAEDTQYSFPFGDVPISRWSNPYVVLLQREGIVSGKAENVFAPMDNVKRAEFVKMLAGVAGADMGEATHTFTDVASGSWYEPYVAWAASNGIVNGMTADTFAPEAQVSRQDMATMIYRYVINVLYAEPAEPPLPVEPTLPTLDPVEPTYILPTETLPPPVIMSDEPPVVVLPTLPEEPAEPTEPTEPFESAEPTEPADPTEPVLPSEPEESNGLPTVNEAITFSDDGDIADYAKEAVSVMQQAGIIGGVANGDDTFRFEPKNKATREQAAKMLAVLYLIINEEKELPEPVQSKAYTIKYVIDSGKMGDAPKEYYTGEGTRVPNPTKEGYTFLGWSGTGLGKPVKNLVLNAPVAGDLTLIAKWTPIKYKITYNLGGAKVSGLKKEYTIKDGFTLPELTRAGYVFDGWSGTGIKGKQKTVKVAAGSMGERSYTANWTVIKYKITYNLDGGKLPAGSPTTYTVNLAPGILPTPTKAGYEFLGWRAKGQSKVDLFYYVLKGHTGDVEVTAVWKKLSDREAAWRIMHEWVGEHHNGYRFGEYWVETTAQTGYESWIKFTNLCYIHSVSYIDGEIYTVSLELKRKSNTGYTGFVAVKTDSKGDRKEVWDGTIKSEIGANTDFTLRPERYLTSPVFKLPADDVATANMRKFLDKEFIRMKAEANKLYWKITYGFDMSSFGL